MSTSPDIHPTLAELDVVELAVDSGRWPKGTVGTVVEMKGETVLAEISDDRGHTLDLLPLPVSAVRRVDVPVQEHLSV